MPNKSSPHGGAVVEGTVIHGTMRAVDLLDALATEYARVLPFNSSRLVAEARSCRAEILEDENHPGNMQTGTEIVAELIQALDTIAGREGLRFGAHEGDGSDYGYWRNDE